MISKYRHSNRLLAGPEPFTSLKSAPETSLPSPITFLLLPDFTSIALFSVVEALRVANRYVPEPYGWKLTSLDGESVSDINGIPVAVNHRFGELDLKEGTVLIAGGDAPEDHCTPELCSRLRWLAARG